MSHEQPPPVGRGGRPRHPERPCLNCGDPTVGEFCPTCGQRKVDVQASVRAMVSDLLEDELLLSRRLPHTLVALLFRPGHLTAEVLDGRIVRYVRPFKLYLVSSVVFFLVLSFVGLRAIQDFGSSVEVNGVTTGDDDPVAMLAAIDSALAEIDSELAADSSDAGSVELGVTRDLLLAQRRSLLEANDSLAATAGAPPGAENGDGQCFSTDDLRVNLGHPRANALVRARLESLAGMPCSQAAQEVARTFLNYVPTAMFLLLPVFAGVLKLLYVRQSRFYAEHMIFLLHTHAFVYAIFTVLLLRPWIFGWIGPLVGWPSLTGWLVAVLIGWALIYIYLAMRRVYGQGTFKTFLKYWTLGWGYFWVLTITVPILFIATLLLLPA